jgi:hypothetical protein
MNEENLIHASELKQNLADYMTNILLDEKLISENELSGLSVRFAYLFKNAESKLESLVMLTTKEGKQFFFALQNNQLQKVRADEAAFLREEQRIEQYFASRPDARPVETDAQKRRKQENLAWLRAHEIACSENLPCLYEDSRAQVKSLGEIRNRAAACFVAIQIACDIQNGRYEDSKAYFAPLLDSGIRGLLNEKELRVVDNCGTPQDALDVAWTYECYWTLCWYLGLVEDIRDASDICDCSKAVSLFNVFLTPDAFQQRCQPRSVAELLDLEDLYFRCHWAVAERQVNPNAGIGDLNPSVVVERRRALEWLLSEEADWNALTLSA